MDWVIVIGDSHLDHVREEHFLKEGGNRSEGGTFQKGEKCWEIKESLLITRHKTHSTISKERDILIEAGSGKFINLHT